MAYDSAPVYAHFLDRELTGSVRVKLSRSDLAAFLCFVPLFGRNLYCSLSAVWEHGAIDNRLRWVMRELTAADLLWTVSNHATAEDFIESRQRLYQFDQRRYPNYFNAPKKPSSPLWTPSKFRPISSTARLVERLPGRVEASHPSLSDGVVQTLSNREDRAITSALFRDVASTQVDLQRVGQAISYLYTQQYVEWLDAEILVGIPGLSYFDVVLTPEPTICSARLMTTVLRALRWDSALTPLWDLTRSAWVGFAKAATEQQHVLSAGWAQILERAVPVASGAPDARRQISLEQVVAAELFSLGDSRPAPQSPKGVVESLAYLVSAAAEPSTSTVFLLSSPTPHLIGRPDASTDSIELSGEPAEDLALLEAKKQTKWARIAVLVAILLFGGPYLISRCSSDEQEPPPDTPTETVAPASTPRTEPKAPAPAPPTTWLAVEQTAPITSETTGSTDVDVAPTSTSPASTTTVRATSPPEARRAG